MTDGGVGSGGWFGETQTWQISEIKSVLSIGVGKRGFIFRWGCEVESHPMFETETKMARRWKLCRRASPKTFELLPDDRIASRTSKMSHDRGWRAACDLTIWILRFHFEIREAARGVTAMVVGSGAWLDERSRDVTSKIESTPLGPKTRSEKSREVFSSLPPQTATPFF